MPCNLVIFISVTRESEDGWGRQRGEDMRKKERSKFKKTQRARKGGQGRGKSITTITDLTMSSNVRLAQSLCRRGDSGEDEVRQQGGKEESKMAQRSMWCSFIGAFARVPYVQFVPYVLPT